MPTSYRKQETDLFCGPAIVQMILATQDLEISQIDIAGEMTTDKRGTPIKAMESYLKAQGFSTRRTNEAQWEDIEDALGERATIVVGYLEKGEDKAHYALVATTTQGEIILTDPFFGPEYRLSREEFERRWKDDIDHAYGNRMMLAVTAP